MIGILSVPTDCADEPYFCNPLPLLQNALAALNAAGFDGVVLVAGRHASHLTKISLPGAMDFTFSLHVCPTMLSLLGWLGVPSAGDSLGAQELPLPGLASVDFIKAAHLAGSASRPTVSVPGQILVQAGCVYRCAFCEKAATPIRSMTTADIQYQTRAYRSGGFDYVIVWDEVFGTGDVHGDALRAFRESGLAFACNTRADLLTPEFVKRLATAGCRAVLLGVEVTSDEDEARRALQVDRGKRPADAILERAVETLSRHGISPVASLLIGLPDDSAATIGARLGHCKALGFEKHYARPIVPFPETALYRDLVARGDLAHYEAWPSLSLDTYPHGYPTLCREIDRVGLCNLANRPA